jgi:hypothetical protein
LADRLKSYKFWRQTGEVPAVTRMRGAITDPSEFEIHRPMKLEQKPKPLELTSFGTVEGFEGALKQPQTRMDRNYLLPGKQRAETAGLYAYPKELSARGEGYARAREGTRARLDIRMPANVVLQSTRERPEVIIPSSTIGQHQGYNLSRLPD